MRIMKLATGLIMIIALDTRAFAEPLPLLLNDGASTINSGSGATIGFKFTVGAASNLQVNALGVWDGTNTLAGDGADGLLAAHDVGLWTSSGTLLGQVTVPSGTGGALVGEFRYTSLATSVTLIAGETYYLGEYDGGGDPWRNEGGTISTSPYAGTYKSCYNVGASLAFPNNVGSVAPYVGPNMLFEPKPAPLSLLLNDGSNTISSADGNTIGFKFTVGNNKLKATALGVWDGKNDLSGDGDDGLLASHDVGLWTSSGTLLGQVTVPSGTGGSLLREFRFASLATPVILTNGQTYYLGEYDGGGDPWRNEGGTVSTSPYVTAFGSCYYAGASLAFPSHSGSQPPYVGPNMIFEIVPPSGIIFIFH